MIRDRGRIKWVSMMLPEHVRLLRMWGEEDTYKARKELDEQQLEVMNSVIFEAFESKVPVIITYYHNNQNKVYTCSIKYWDHLNRQLSVLDQYDKEHRIYLENIIDVKWAH